MLCPLLWKCYWYHPHPDLPHCQFTLRTEILKPSTVSVVLTGYHVISNDPQNGTVLPKMVAQYYTGGLWNKR